MKDTILTNYISLIKTNITYFTPKWRTPPSGAHPQVTHPNQPIKFKCIYLNHNAIKLIQLTNWSIWICLSSMS
jgi:hypothetical protein